MICSPFSKSRSSLVAVIVIVDYLRDENKPTTGDPADLTTSDPRCLRLRQRQEAARQRMKREGIKSLLDGKRAWQTIKPMSDPEPSAQVIQMGKRNRK